MPNLYDLMAQPQYWGGMLPQLGEYDVHGDYLAAIQSAYDQQNIPAYAAASGGAAGLSPQSPNYGRTAGDLAADALTRAYMGRYQHGTVKGSPLAFESRVAMRPEEARAAYDSFQLSPEGLPQADLPPFVLAALEALGYVSGTKAAPGQFGGGEGGGPTEQPFVGDPNRLGERRSGPPQTPGVPDPTRLADQGQYDRQQPHIFGLNQPGQLPPAVMAELQRLQGAGPMRKTVAPPRPTQ